MKKNFKFLLLSALCVVAFSLSSCLNSNDNSSGSGVQIVRVSYGLGTPNFVDYNGNIYVPKSLTISGTTITPTDGDIAYIYYTINSSTYSSSTKTYTYSVTLSYYVDLETTYNNKVFNIAKGAVNDSITNFHFAQDSLVSVGANSYSGVSMFGTHLLACLNYYPNNGNGNFNNVFYYSDQNLSKGTNKALDTVKVWLCHHSIGNLINYTSYNYVGSAPYIYYFGYNLANALGNAESQEASLQNRDSVIVELNAKIASGNKAVWSQNLSDRTPYCCTYKFGN